MKRGSAILAVLAVVVVFSAYQSDKEAKERAEFEARMRERQQTVQANSIYNVPNAPVYNYSVPDYSIDYYSSSSENDSVQTPSLCGVCRGTKACSVCKGLGIYEMFGNSSPCTACNADGNCWNCGGTGYN